MMIPGTYSLDPLVGPTGEPGCFDCPAGGDCSLGGDSVAFAEGNWTVAGGMYVLSACPPGHSRVSTADDSTAFNHDLQQCKPCTGRPALSLSFSPRRCPVLTLRGFAAGLEYIINPQEHTCTECPAGAECWDGSLLVGKDEGAVWVPDQELGVYRLQSCPTGVSSLVRKAFEASGVQDLGFRVQGLLAGFRVSVRGLTGRVGAGTEVVNTSTAGVFEQRLQQCVPCSEGKECTAPSCERCSSCAPGSYKVRCRPARERCNSWH
eukprot:1438142-Rhodomonas_salina.2